MKKLIAVVALVGIVAGCSYDPVRKEAERFGYKGRDLGGESDRMFFSSGAGVTNWVPTRVLTVREHYEYTTNELALIKAAGIIMPSSELAEIPSGFSAKVKEPWFTTWTKDIEAFGRKGTCGFISHYDDSKKKWETNENYFSSYYDAESNAVQALVALEADIAKFSPKKFYHFDKCWVAEYLRLRVMALVGQRPDGKWTCMLSINDKVNPGCGPWEPIEDQQERVDELAYLAEIKAKRCSEAE